MYYLFSCDFCFEIEADGYDKALKKAWAFIHANLPKDFELRVRVITHKRKRDLILAFFFIKNLIRLQ